MRNPTAPSPSFDHIVKGDVTIKKLSKHSIKLHLAKSGNFSYIKFGIKIM